MGENDRAHAKRVRRALDELLARLARAAIEDWKKKQAAKGTKKVDLLKPKSG